MRGQKLQRNMVQGKAKVSPVPQPQGNEDGGPTEAPNDDRDQKVQAEMAKIQMEHEEYLSQRSIRETEIAIITSGLIFEDLLMSMLNISLIWTAKDFEQFRAHPLFAMAAISTITSLLVLGLKIGEVLYSAQCYLFWLLTLLIPALEGQIVGPVGAQERQTGAALRIPAVCRLQQPPLRPAELHCKPAFVSC